MRIIALLAIVAFSLSAQSKAKKPEKVEILEVTKLKEEMGEKTVAVDAFEGNNLVMVDEGRVTTHVCVAGDYEPAVVYTRPFGFA